VKKYLIGFLILGAIGFIIEKLPKSDEQKAKDIEESEAKKNADSLKIIETKRTDSLTNCYIFAETQLKKGLKDPNSYERISHQEFFVKNDSKKEKIYIQVVIEYSATNSFGGRIREKRCFDFDKLTDLIEVYKCN
jgi:hypothetical protein